MLKLNIKISLLENYLNDIQDNFADSFKTDICFYICDFNNENSKLNFLNHFSSQGEIENWVNTLTSRIVMKYDNENEQLSDFIYDYISNS